MQSHLSRPASSIRGFFRNLIDLVGSGAMHAISRHIVTFQSPTEAPVDLRDDHLTAQAVEGDLYSEMSWLSYDLSLTSARAAENRILLDAAVQHSCLHT